MRISRQVRNAIAALALLPGAGLAAETQWRFDGTVESVTSPWDQWVSAGAPVRGVFVLDRSQPYVETGDACSDGAIRSFYAVRLTSFFLLGVSGTLTTPMPAGVSCAPGSCDLTVQIFNFADPPACLADAFEVDLDAGQVFSPQLGPVTVEIRMQPDLPAAGIYTSIPEIPWPSAPDGLSGVIAGPGGSIQLAVGSLVRAPVCGDLNLDLVVDATDVGTTRASLANPTFPLPPGGAARCSVIGGTTDCDVVDVAVLERMLGGALPPGIQQVCAAMNGG